MGAIVACACPAAVTAFAAMVGCAAIAGGCAMPDPAPPPAPVPLAAVASPPPVVGRLLVFDFREGLFLCAHPDGQREGTCARVDVPGAARPIEIVERDSQDRYFLALAGPGRTQVTGLWNAGE